MDGRKALEEWSVCRFDEQTEEEYELDHGNVWLSEDVIVSSSAFLLVAYYLRENTREKVKAEDVKVEDGWPRRSSNDFKEESAQKCRICLKIFVLYGDFQNHMLRTHNAKVAEYKSKLRHRPLGERLSLHSDACGRKARNWFSHNNIAIKRGIEMAKRQSKKDAALQPEKAVVFDKRCKYKKRLVKDWTYKNSFKCEICHKIFTQKGSLKTHMRVHTGEKPYRCEICNQRFTSSSCFIYHMRVHTGDKPYKCDRCDNRYHTTGSLKYHVMSVHTEEKPFKCKTCNKRFIRLADLKSHSVRHSDVKPFKCEVCDKRFRRGDHLRYHSSIHVEVKPLKCKLCDRTFSTHCNLKFHVMSTHTGERPFKCEICSKEYVTSNHLKRHLTIHSGEKPYICDVCGKAFNNSSHLKRHIGTHLRKNSIK